MAGLAESAGHRVLSDDRTVLTAETDGTMSIDHGVAGPLEGPPLHVHAHEDVRQPLEA